jgi:prepilin-type N-terminal cleavage/methylation domain-containing protein
MQRKKSAVFSSAENGFNLIEVLIAMALIGSVLLSVLTLFFLSRRNVYSGKQMSQAVAVGTHALEDLSTLNVNDIFTAFNITSTSALATYQIDGVTYPNAIIRSTHSNVVASPPADILAETDPDGTGSAVGFLSTWRNEMNTNQKFQDGTVTVIIMPRAPVTVMDSTNTTVPSRGVKQIRVIVRWNENGRVRNAVFDTTKVKR